MTAPRHSEWNIQQRPDVPGPQPERIDLGDGAVLELVRGFVADHEAVMARLLTEVPLEQESIRMIGRLVPVPRLVAFHGDAGKRYRYSGRDHVARPWTPALLALVEQLRAFTGTPYDTVLCNYYRDGRDAMGRHSDDEKELGPAPDDVRIASISLGGRRRFAMRRKDGDARRAFELGEGDLLVMRGTTQTHWTHEVPRTSSPVLPRWNLTFRCVVG